MSETSLPQHIGIIMDGNRRWAKTRGLPASEGHRRGYLTLRHITKSIVRRGIKYLTAYVFSTENWKRDKQEVESIVKLLTWALKHEVEGLHKEGVRLRVLGSKLKFGVATTRAILHAEELTKYNTRATLLVCLDYGGQQEIVDAVKRIAAAGIEPEAITPQLITQYLYAPDVPPIDLVVRTSGEQRLSNFMLWESAYSELAFVGMPWPDFDDQALDDVLTEYASRHRRFGK